jgi:phosphoglycerol transferase
MSFFLIQFLILIGFSLIVISLSKNTWFRAIVSGLFSFFVAVQILSIYLNGNLVDYRFIEHCNLRDTMLFFNIYIPEFILAMTFILSLWAILFFTVQKYLSFKALNAYLKFGLILVCVYAFTQPKGIINNIYQVSKIHKISVSSFEEAITNIGIDRSSYVYPDDIKAKDGKNIIILSLESFEASYLKPNLAHLTPNLNKLAKEYSYYNIAADDGSAWTLSSLYTYMTGVPMYIEGDKTYIFKSAKATQLTGISHVLKSADYQQLYIMGKPEFGATNELLKLYQINLKSEKNYEGSHLKTHWGLHDKDLFDFIKLEIDSFDQRNQKFALYASSISTHGPGGVYDSRMEEYIEPQNSNLEFMVKSVDYLIGDLIDFLEFKGLLDETVFYIFPDHALMGPNLGIAQEFQDPGSLFLITNATNQIEKYPVTDTLLQIDLPVVILDGAETTHNAKFMTQYIKGNKKAFLEERKSEFLTLNLEALVIDSLSKN